MAVTGDDLRTLSQWFLSYGFADVHDQLVVGAYPLDAGDVSLLERIGIRQVLNLVQEQEYAPGQRSEVRAALRAAGIVETRLSLVDYGHLPAEALEAAVTTVAAWLRKGERSYLHCRAGWQRSAAVAAGAIAIHDGIDIELALDQVRRRKPTADPLPHQREDLLAWWSARA